MVAGQELILLAITISNGHSGVEVGFESKQAPSYFDTVLYNNSRLLQSTVKKEEKEKEKKKKKSRVGACRSQHHVSWECGVDTCRLIDFPVVASGQLHQPFREWLGEANNQMLFFNLYRQVKNKVRRLQDIFGLG